MWWVGVVRWIKGNRADAALTLAGVRGHCALSALCAHTVSVRLAVTTYYNLRTRLPLTRDTCKPMHESSEVICPPVASAYFSSIPPYISHRGAGPVSSPARKPPPPALPHPYTPFMILALARSRPSSGLERRACVRAPMWLSLSLCTPPVPNRISSIACADRDKSRSTTANPVLSRPVSFSLLCECELSKVAAKVPT